MPRAGSESSCSGGVDGAAEMLGAGVTAAAAAYAPGVVVTFEHAAQGAAKALVEIVCLQYVGHDLVDGVQLVDGVEVGGVEVGGVEVGGCHVFGVWS